MDSLTKLEPLHRRDFPFQTFVARLTICTHTVPIGQYSSVLNNPWDNVVVTRDLRTRMGLEGQLYRACLAFH